MMRCGVYCTEFRGISFRCGAVNASVAWSMASQTRPLPAESTEYMNGCVCISLSS